MDGVYKIKLSSKNNAEQAQAALQAIWGNLSKS